MKDNFFGQERAITTPDGREWTLGRLEVRLVRAFGVWVAKQEGDPFMYVERYLGKISEAAIMPYFKEAEDTARQLKAFSLACPVARKHLSREEGVAEFYRLLLSAKHPSVTEEDALYVAINDKASLAEAIEHAEGSPPKNAAPPAA